MSWGERRMLALDFESDSVDPTTARVVQVACVDLRPADRGVASAPAWDVERWATLVDPGDGFEMPAAAEAIHGLSTERVRREGRPSAEVIPEVASKLADCWASGGIVVGHNLGGYDLTLLDAELRRHGCAPLEVRGCVIDTLTLDRCDLLDRADRFRKNADIAPDGEPVRSRKLVDAVRWWQVPMAQELAHDATEDALASARIAWRIARVYPAIAEMDLRELHAYQARQHAAWAENFEKYLKRKKAEDDEPQEAIDAVHIPREWPLRTTTERRAAA